LQEFDNVGRLAPLSNDLVGNLDPQLTSEMNYLASVRLAQLSKAAGVRRFVMFSSCGACSAAGLTFEDID